MIIPDYELISAGFLVENRKVFIAQRSAFEQESLKWEFPGGKLKEDEHYDEALIREFKEEFKIDIEIIQELGSAEIDVNGKMLIITFLLIKGDTKKIKLNVHNQSKFVYLKELKSLDLCEADRQFIENFENELREFID